MDDRSIYSGLRKHVLTLLSGTALSQLIPILTLPLLARLYSPEAFGVFSMSTATAALLGVVFTLCFELVIVLAKDEQEAGSALSLVWATSTSMFLVSLILIVCLADVFDASSWIQRYRQELMLMCIGAWLIGINQALLSWTNRHGQYAQMATSAVLQQLVAVVVRLALGFGVLALSLNGLYLGTLVGQVVSIVVLLRFVMMRGPRPGLSFKLSDLLRVAASHRHLPTFRAPYSVLGTVSRDSLIYLLSAGGFLAAAGSFGFARSCISIPVTFLSSSLGQIYLQRVAGRFQSAEVENFTLLIMSRLRVAFVPLFCGLMIWAPDLFQLVFGSKWRDAGVYAAVYAPAVFFYLFSSWLRLFEASGRQKLQLSIQVISDVATGLCVWAVMGLTTDPLWAVACYSVCAALYHMSFVLGSFTAAGFAKVGYLTVVRDAFRDALGWGVLLSVVRYIVTPHAVLGIGVSAVFVCMYYWLRRVELAAGPREHQ